jgi:hypothetical protein
LKVGLAVGGMIGSFLTYSAFTRVILTLSLITYFMNNATIEIRWFWLAATFVATLGLLNDFISFLSISLCALILTRVHRKEHLGTFKFDRHSPAVVAFFIVAAVFSFGGLEGIVKADKSYASHIYAGSKACAIIVRFILLFFISYSVVLAAKSGVGEKEESWKMTAGIMLPFAMSAILALLVIPSGGATWKSMGMGLARYALSISLCPIVFLTGYL